MIYSNNNYELFSKIKNCGICATIGNFDGVHLGHQSLINKIVDISNNESYMSLVISFWPHPLSILRPNNGCASMLFEPIQNITSASLILSKPFVIAPEPKVVAKPATVGP